MSLANGLTTTMRAPVMRIRKLIPKVNRILVRLLQLRALGKREGVRLGPLAVTSAPAVSFTGLMCTGTSAGGAAGALTGCDVIDPYSSHVKRHQLHVTVELQPGVEIVNPNRRHHSLGLVKRGLGLNQLVGKGGGIGCRSCHAGLGRGLERIQRVFRLQVAELHLALLYPISILEL